MSLTYFYLGNGYILPFYHFTICLLRFTVMIGGTAQEQQLMLGSLTVEAYKGIYYLSYLP